MPFFLIRSVRIVNSDTDFVGDVLLREGKIAQVAPSISAPAKIEVFDGTGKWLFPGLMDAHVHFRDPGLTKKEDFASGSRAAVAGGVTTFFDMPNTIPPTFTLENLEEKRNLARQKSRVNFGLFFGAGHSNVSELKRVQNVPGIKLYLNHTTGDLRMTDEKIWKSIFRLGRKVVLHAEGDTFAQAVHLWQKENFPCELHLAHLSLRSELSLIRALKSDPHSAQKISCEVTPHHLLLTEKDLKTWGNFAQMKPPINSSADREALWEGVSDGTIDIFATDHAPHTIAEKERGAFGIPGVETLLPLLLTEFRNRKLPLTLFTKMTSARVRELYHIQDKKGRIAPGFDADLTLVDPTKTHTIDPKKFFSHAKWSPFSGREVSVCVEKTFMRGELMFDSGRMMNDEVRGQEVKFSSL